MKFERVTQVRLPFDMRSPRCDRNYGIHGLDVWFVLKGPKGAVQFAVNFGVYLPSVTHVTPGDIYGFDVGCHSLVPQYEGQTERECEHLPGGKCYYDGSGTAADEWAREIFGTVGRPPEEVLWPMLEKEYRERFGEDE